MDYRSLAIPGWRTRMDTAIDAALAGFLGAWVKL